MKLRCSPYNPVILVVFFGIIIGHTSSALAQCQGDFTYQSFSSDENASSGKIEITLKNPGAGNYTFKVYDVDGPITLVKTKQAPSPEKVIIENLAASTYFVKIEWGDSCYKTIGGLEGIIITRKAKGK